MARFNLPKEDIKFRIPTPDQDKAWDKYQTETKARIDSDFTINAFDNVDKTYRKRSNRCDIDKIIVISPGSKNFENVIVLPTTSPCPSDADGDSVDDSVICYSPDLVVSPDAIESECAREEIRGPDQIPFALATRGVIFRRRNAPYFTSAGGTKTFMDEVIS
mgnify:CR=1 FL=1|tara:strand:- start:583 stop:1068 length:486 start_codon:yes stop_codon:yes gene_type:complete